MAGGDHQEPLLAPGRTIVASARPARDVSWALCWALFMLASVVGGVYAALHRNPDFAHLISHDYLANPRHCPAGSGPSRHLLEAVEDNELGRPVFFLEAAGACTAVSVAGGVVLGVASLLLWKARPQAMVGLSVGLQVGLPAAAGLAVALSAGLGAAAPLFLASGVLGATFWLYRPQLDLVGRLLKVSAACIADNALAVIGGSLLIQLGGLLVLLPLLAGMLLAYANGGVVANAAAAAVSAEGQFGCVDAAGNDVLCCAWQPDSWAVGYMALAGLMLAWSSLLVFTVKVFTLSGITAQWFFALPGDKPRAPLMTSLRHAFGPSFGSLCLASWLLNLLSMLKQLVESARGDNGRDSFLLTLLASCAQLIISVLEQITKFAVVRVAITGEALLAACRSTTELLKRNMLDTVGVWWLPGLILQVTSLLLAGVWALAVGGFAYSFWGGAAQGAGSSALALGGLAAVLGVLSLSFLSGILLNIVDAAYVCYALDRDSGMTSRQDVHDVYAQLPSNKAPGGVIEHPDTTYAFGSV